MKTIILFSVLVLVSAAGVRAQDKFLCKHGHIWFYSHTPMEDVEAHNNESASVITASSGEVIYQVLIKSFKFRRALMEEHFNENYMESDMYPKSDFKGKIVNLKEINFTKPGVYKTTVEGDLTMHGKKNHIKHDGTLEVKDGKLLVKAKFSVIPQEYGIEIPSAVRDKIAKSMDVTVDMVYDPITK